MTAFFDKMNPPNPLRHAHGAAPKAHSTQREPWASALTGKNCHERAPLWLATGPYLIRMKCSASRKLSKHLLGTPGPILGPPNPKNPIQCVKKHPNCLLSPLALTPFANGSAHPGDGQRSPPADCAAGSAEGPLNTTRTLGISLYWEKLSQNGPPCGSPQAHI